MPARFRKEWIWVASPFFVLGIIGSYRHLRSLWAWHPWPGLFVAILALVGVLVPLLKESLSKKEKAVWTAILTLLAVAEIRSLQLAAGDARTDRKEQNDRFERIRSGLQDAADSITGGDSWPHLEIVETTVDQHPGGLALQLVVEGCCPMRHVQIKVLDPRRYKKIASGRQLTFSEALSDGG
jgi:hypothetical protein